MLPLALVGVGARTFREYNDRGRFILNKETLTYGGFSEAQQQRILSARSVDEATAIYREEYGRRSPADIAAGLEKLNAQADTLAQQVNDPAMPRLETATSASGERVWRVREPDGRQYEFESQGEALVAYVDSFERASRRKGSSPAQAADPTQSVADQSTASPTVQKIVRPDGAEAWQVTDAAGKTREFATREEADTFALNDPAGKLTESPTGRDGESAGNEPSAPYWVSKEGAKVLAFNANPKADWERAQVVRSTGKEIFGEVGIPQGSKLKGILAVIREWGERTGLYSSHRTPALNADVTITKRAIINDLSHWAGNEKVLSVAALPKLLESAVYIQTQKFSNQPGIKQHILAAKLDIGGTPYVVSLVVREREGNLFYDHELIESDKGEPYAGTPIGTNTRGGQQDDSPSVGRVVKEALGVKPKSSGSVGEKGTEEVPANLAPGEAGARVVGESTSAESPVADQAEQGGTSLGTPPQTESKARFGEKEFYFDEDPNSLEFVRSFYEDEGPDVKAAVKRVDAIWEEFRREMDKLGVEIEYSRPDERSECMVEGDKIVFYLGYDKLVGYEKNAPPEKVAPGEATRMTLGEELIHAVHLKELERDWQRSKSPDDLNTYIATRQRGAFADMRKTIEGASEKDREVMLRTIRQSHDVYFRQFEKDMPESPSEKDILAFIENKGDSPTFMNEFMRQIVQLSEQRNITEGVRYFIEKAKEWVERWLKGLHEGLPGAFSGDFGPELQAQVKQIQKGLDQIDRKVFRGRPASP